MVRLLAALSTAEPVAALRDLARDGRFNLALAEGRLDPAEVARVCPDLLIVDGPSLGDDLTGELVARRGTRPGPGVIFVTGGDREAPAGERALAAGAWAVLDGGRNRRDFGDAMLALVGRWRERSVSADEVNTAPVIRFGEFLTKSRSLGAMLRTAERVASTDTSVLILGDTGVGKERLAASIHAHSRRHAAAMVVVNCGAIPESLLESELFGHERGAFTGAQRTHRGYFELAHGGTLFLDEIGEMPMHLQVKLLRVLQERVVKRVGGERNLEVDVRVIAATNRDLQQDMDQKRFRPDLFYRLSVVSLTVPPLCQRREDIDLLAQRYLERFCNELGVEARAIAPAAMQALRSYDWPGNVREVANVMERAVVLCDGSQVGLEHLPDAIAAASPCSSVGGALAAATAAPPPWLQLPLREARPAWNAFCERAYLDLALRESKGRIGRAAQRIGIDPRSLYTKMKSHGLRKEDYRLEGR